MTAARTDMSPAVELQHVSVAFQHPVLRDVSLHVSTAETVAVIGESGTGKPTMLRLIFALQQPDHGVVRVMGEDLQKTTAQ